MIEVNKIAIPFAKSGNKSVIYDTRQQGQAENEATWSTGFPPVTMIRKEDGGLPPTGLDFNGIFYDISSNVVFSCMGGHYKFDAEYAEKIGGYPKGAILLNNQENMQYISNVDNNKVDFNSVDPSKLTVWSIISIADIDKLLSQKIDNADFSSALNQKANVSTNINAGNGLTGGGTLETSRTLSLGTPSIITQSSKNSVTASSHTHEIAKATTAQAGIIQLTNALSDKEDVAPTIKAVNDVNRAASTAQKTANNAHALAQTKQDKLMFVGSGSEVLKTGAYGLGSFATFAISVDDYEYRKNQFVNYWDTADDATRRFRHGIRSVPHTSEIENFTEILFTHGGGNVRVVTNRKDSEHVQDLYSDKNTTTDKSGFLRASGSVNALTESDRTSSLGTSTTLVASQKLVNDVSARTTTAQNRADSAYNLANSAIPNSKKTSNLGTSTDLVATQKLVNDVANQAASHGIGYGQKWVDVTSQRSVDTNYVNNTGKPIFISIYSNHSALGSKSIKVSIDGLVATYADTDGATDVPINLLVPVGSTYKVELTAFILGTHVFWTELR